MRIAKGDYVKIQQRYTAGQTLQEIGDSYGVSRQRIQQILKIVGLTRKDGGATFRKIERESKRLAAKEAHYLAKYGHTRLAHRKLVHLGRSMMATGMGWEQTPVGAFVRQRQNAKQRGIEFNLNLSEWWSVWQTSGKFDARGKGHEHYVMSRKNDVGPYALGNVYIQLADINNSDRLDKLTGLPIGIYQARSGRFYVRKMINGTLVHLGVYDSLGSAMAAYGTGQKLPNAVSRSDAQQLRYEPKISLAFLSEV